MKKKKKVKLTKLSKKIIFLIVTFVAVYFLATYPFAIELKGNKEITIEVFEEYTDPGINLKIGNTYKTVGEVDTSTIGTYVLKYWWLTERLSRTVYVVDTTSPSITINGNRDIYATLNEEYIDQGAVATDNYDGDITNQIEIQNMVNINEVGDYKVVYSVKDSSGNITSDMRNVFVRDDDYNYGSANNKNYANENVINTILGLTNRYYLNMKYLINMTYDEYFSNEEYKYLFDKISQMSVQMHKDMPIDLSIYDVDYEIDIQEYKANENGYYVYLKETFNIIYNYNLNNTNTSVIDCYYYLDKNYKITKFERDEGCFYTIFEKYKSNNDWKTNINNLIDTYYLQHKTNIDKFLSDLSKINAGEISVNTVITKRSNYAYNRSKAVDYALKYALRRNSDYFFITDNNCVNYVSQCLHYGGLPMVTTGSNQWKNYDYYLNDEDGKEGFTYSWTGTSYFIDFLNKSNKIIAQTHITPFLAVEGDVIMFGSSKDGLGHATIVTSVVKDEEGNIIDILFSGNTNMALNMSLMASTALYYECEKIIGYN